MSTGTARTPRAILDDVFGPTTTRQIWSADYHKAIPISFQLVDLTAILPAVFYMFRFGHRRGKGRFLDTFGQATPKPQASNRSVTIRQVAARLAQDQRIRGFEDPVGQVILGDLLLCFCLENRRRAPGHTEPVQRVAPTHYLASWIDLPQNIAHLRFVPEMIVTMLTGQVGDTVQPTPENHKTWFPVARDVHENLLLHAFAAGVECASEFVADEAADKFRETATVGLDQLIMIRIAQQLQAAPDKLRGGKGQSRIPNQHPIASRAGREFSEDLRKFVREFATVVPRHTFLDLLESCISVGLTTIFGAVVNTLFTWAETGTVPEQIGQQPTPLFVDCSNGVDRRLRSLAEQSLDDFLRRLSRLAVILMALRLLDHAARYDPSIRKRAIKTRPTATRWLNLLGEILHKRVPEAELIHRACSRDAAQLAEALSDDYAQCVHVLENTSAEPNPVWRLAAGLTSLQGHKYTQGQFTKFFDSIAMVDRPNGLARKRKTIRRGVNFGTRRYREVRCVVFTDSVLEYLVHRHLLASGSASGVRLLPLRDFLKRIRERYGFCVDVPPRGMSISNELLHANRAILERRLRDLGLLTGVSDAEAMKRLQPRFEPAMEEPDGVDEDTYRRAQASA